MQWNFSQRAITELRDAALSPIQDWLTQHPILLWLMSHPLWLLGALLLTLFLLAGLLRAIASLTEQLWIALLRLPLTFVQLIWRGATLLWRPLMAKSVTAQMASVEPLPSHSNRLNEVIDRLDALRQEEQELMQEMKALLKTQNPD